MSATASSYNFLGDGRGRGRERWFGYSAPVEDGREVGWQGLSDKRGILRGVMMLYVLGFMRGRVLAQSIGCRSFFICEGTQSVEEFLIRRILPMSVFEQLNYALLKVWERWLFAL